VDGHVRDSFGRQGGLIEVTRSASQKTCGPVCRKQQFCAENSIRQF
jgi:hypothetical protein